LKHGYFAPHKSTPQYITLYVVTPFLLYVYYQIRKGLRGAKTLFLALYALLLFQLLNDGISSSSYNTSLKLGSLVVQHMLQGVACALLLLSLRTPTETSINTTTS